MRRPRVAIITPGTFPIPSGVSSSVERVVEYVASYAADRLNIKIYAKQWPGQEPLGDVRGVPCERVRAGNERSYIRLVLRRLHEFKPDVIQIENRPQFVRVIRAAMPQVKIWLNLHSTTFVQSRYMKRYAQRAALQRADCIQVNSQYVFDQVNRLAPGIAARMMINPLGVDSNRFISRYSENGQLYSEAERQLRGWVDRKVILFVGRLVPLKGVHHLLNAVSTVVQCDPSALFVIVGGASYGSRRKTAYVRRLERLGQRYPQHVRFIPYTAHDDIPKLYAAANIVVVPSVRREAFGLVNVEAMASGVPVVATRVGGIQEVVLDQVTGILLTRGQLSFRLAEVLKLLLSQPALAEQMGRAGVERVAMHYTWEQTSERWTNALLQSMPFYDVNHL